MDKDQTRERLLDSALEIFAAKGYEGASTRDICAAAGIGNASIHYHFGDKAAIYRELFVRLLDEFEERLRGCGMGGLPGHEALSVYYRTMLAPWAEEQFLPQKFYLYLREEFQPTGIVSDQLPRALRLQVEMLGEVLRRELKIKKLDVAALRLVATLQGVGLGYMVQHQSFDLVLPELVKGTHWLDRITAHLADAGWELIKAEQRRRAVAPGIE